MALRKRRAPKILMVVNDTDSALFSVAGTRIRRKMPFEFFDEKCPSNLLATPSHSLASAGGSFLAVIFGHDLAYSALTVSHFSTPGSVSGLIASTGHSGSQTPQSMHSSGWMTSIFSPS